VLTKVQEESFVKKTYVADGDFIIMRSWEHCSRKVLCVGLSFKTI